MRQQYDEEKGATLLSVLVIVMLMSAAAVAATDALARSIMVARSSGARAETFWTARGAADAAAAYLAKAMETTGGALNEESALFTQPVTLPAGHGIVAITVREASNCFNLNALLDDTGAAGVADDQLMAYRDFLTATGLNEAEAQSLADKLADWIDSDMSSRTYGAEDGYYASRAEPYRTAGARLRSLSELSAVAGYDPEILARIGNLVCLRPGIAQSVLNVNTLTPDQAPLLSGLFSAELSESEALSLIEGRPPGGWADVDVFLQEPLIVQIAPNARHDAAVSVVSSYLAADVDVGTGDLATAYRALYGRAAGGAVSLVSLVRRDF